MYERMLDKQNKPTIEEMTSYCGENAEFIDNRYPCGDGGWIHYRITCKKNFEDIQMLLAVKCSR